LHGETGHDLSVLIDAHVHLHDCFLPTAFLDSAHRNFTAAARACGWPAPLGILMLTESQGADQFGRLAKLAGDPAAIRPWTVTAAPDPCALDVRSGERRLIIVAGRQVVCLEGLEVHVLGTRATIPDGGSLSDVLAEGARLRALRVVPWGAGKWLFGRGRILSEAIATQRPGDGFFLSDASGRPFFWPTPRHFKEAARRGIRVLRGTDPLPLPAELGRAGRFGFRLEGALDLDHPTEGIASALRDERSRLTPYGRLERTLPFVRHQVFMQQRKRQ
jgi:hypothetical protein